MGYQPINMEGPGLKPRDVIDKINNARKCYPLAETMSKSASTFTTSKFCCILFEDLYFDLS